MEGVIDELKGKLDEVHGAVQKLGQSYAVLNVELISVKDTLVKLADVNGELISIRTESLHLVKKHDECRKDNREDHDEIFTRLRAIENKESAAEQDRKSMRKDLKELEAAKTWGMRLFFASTISAFISAAGFVWVAFFRHVSLGG